MKTSKSKNGLNTYYHINAFQVEKKENGVLECMINERTLFSLIKEIESKKTSDYISKNFGRAIKKLGE